MKEQWESMEWLKSITNKTMSSFVNFDLENVYPLTSEKPSMHIIIYVKSLIDVTEEEYSVIIHSNVIRLFQNSELRIIKDSNEDFDVPLGYYSGTEICKLADLFILNEVGPVIDKNDIGLCWVDGLGIFRGISELIIERKKKNVAKTTKNVDSPSL